MTKTLSIKEHLAAQEKLQEVLKSGKMQAEKRRINIEESNVIIRKVGKLMKVDVIFTFIE